MIRGMGYGVWGMGSSEHEFRVILYSELCVLHSALSHFTLYPVF